ncbi:MAG: response regulator [Elusimicrobiota bacterium]|nr:response regulator [Elusimicrobiota bacterium]
MRGKILIVDDDKILRSGIIIGLKEYEVIETSNAKDALAIIKKPNELDLIILDINMPGMSGLEMLKKIKDISPEKKVIIMTGYSTKNVAIEALKNKADNYIEKPFDIKVIRALIEKELLNKAGSASPSDMNNTDKIEHVKWFLEGNCLKKVTLKDAAEIVYMNPKYLSRLFRENTGMGFNEYKLKIKMEQAKKMLTSTALAIKQISYKLGYANTESFIRQFKKILKITPTQYRKNNK